MILVGNQRGGAQDLARHLLKEENDHVELHELRGFASDTLPGALNEAYAVSRGTRCKQFLFSLSLNPPPGENVPTDAFEKAVDRVETQLGLQGQPRAIVFHEKEGRRHAHAVWSRIDIEAMKAVQLSHSKLKLQTVSRELYREHGWKMPRGLADRSQRDPRNFTLEEWQQTKRQSKDPRAIKEAIQDAWAMSDSKTAFQHALEERGYQLAKGDRCAFVAVGFKGNIHSLGKKWVGVPVKELRARIGDESKLQSITEAQERQARTMTATMQRLQDELETKAKERQTLYERRKKQLIERQRTERHHLKERHERRAQIETQTRQTRFRPGLKGLWDHLRGEHKRIQRQNELEALKAHTRDRQEKDSLIFAHLEQRKRLTQRQTHEHERQRQQVQEVKAEARSLEGKAAKAREERKAAHQESRARLEQQARPRPGGRGPER